MARHADPTRPAEPPLDLGPIEERAAEADRTIDSAHAYGSRLTDLAPIQRSQRDVPSLIREIKRLRGES